MTARRAATSTAGAAVWVHESIVLHRLRQSGAPPAVARFALQQAVAAGLVERQVVTLSDRWATSQEWARVCVVCRAVQEAA